jgi:tetratricopeptide (TPR) repeat protein/putative methionine-R-sulfoxide reductase with GAF domain
MPEGDSRIDRAKRILRIDSTATAALLADTLWLASVLPVPKSDKPIASDAEPPILEKTNGSRATVSEHDQSLPLLVRPPESDPKGRIYPSQSDHDDGTSMPATFVSVPAADALPNRLAIERALKPFLKRLPSRRQKQLNHEKTAELSADRRHITPVFAPVPERWFDVLLLVERSDAMEVWADTVRDLQMLLGRHGAFRRVRTFRFEARETVSLFSESGHLVPANAATDPEGRRLCLFLTNGTSVAWRQEPLITFVRSMSRRTVLAIIQMLPRKLWVHTSLGDATERLYSLVPGAPNSTLQIEDAFSGMTKRVDDTTCVPVLTLEANSVGYWARFVMAPRKIMSPAIQLSQGASHVLERRAQTPAESVATFRAIASPEGFRLLRLLAGAPLTLPIMRLIQQSVTTSREQFHLAEVMLSGLIERITPRDAVISPSHIIYEFIPGVRETLLDTHSSRESEILDDTMTPVQERLRAFVEAHTNTAIHDFRALMWDPQGLERLPASARSFVEVSRRIYEKRGILPAVPHQLVNDMRRGESDPEPPQLSFELEPRIPESESIWPIQLPLRKVQILWVDDNPRSSEQTTATLLSMGASIVQRLSTKEAMSILSGRGFDIIVTNMSRGQESEAGLDLLRKLGSDGFIIPTIVYSSLWSASIGARTRAKAAGAFAACSGVSELVKCILDATGRASVVDRFLNVMRTIGFDESDALTLIQLQPKAVADELAERAGDPQGLLQMLVTAIDAITGCDYVQLFLGKERLMLAAEHIGNGKTRYKEASRSSVIGHAHDSGATQYVPNIRVAKANISAEPSTQSVLAIPILNRTLESIGALNVEAADRDAFSKRQTHWLEQVIGAYPLPRQVLKTSIVHISADVSLAQRVELALRRAEFDVVRQEVSIARSFFARFQSGKSVTAQGRRNCYVALVSKAALASDHFNRSITMATAADAFPDDTVRVISLLLEPCQLPAELEALRAIDMTSDIEKGVGYLKSALQGFRLYPEWVKANQAEEEPQTSEERADDLESSGYVAFEREDYEAAITLYGEALKLHPRGRIYRERGAAYWYSRRYAQAIADYTTALEMDPEQEISAKFARGQVLADVGRYEEALEDLDYVVRSETDREMIAYVYRARGVARSRLKQYVGAKEDFELSKRLAPNNAWLYYSMASVLETEPSQDLQVFHLYVMSLYYREPQLNHPNVLDAIAKIEQVTGELGINAEEIKRELTGDELVILDRVGHAMRLGWYGMALLEAEVLREFDLVQQRAALLRCVCHRKLGNFEFADHEIRMLFATNAPSAEAFVERGHARLRSGDVQGAKSDFLTVPQGPDGLCGLALVALLLEELSQAQQLIDSALRLTETNAECFFAKGLILAASGQRISAASVYEQALQQTESPLSKREKKQVQEALNLVREVPHNHDIVDSV